MTFHESYKADNGVVYEVEQELCDNGDIELRFVGTEVYTVQQRSETNTYYGKRLIWQNKLGDVSIKIIYEQMVAALTA